MTRAVENPLVRGGLTIIAGILAGNLFGVIRVAAIAYLLGTGSPADALAVAMGPIDSLNQVLIAAMIFAFVPLLTEREGNDRRRLFLQIRRLFAIAMTVMSAGIVLFAPHLVRVLAPGLAAEYSQIAANILRITAPSSAMLGVAGVHSALLYTERRFAPSAIHQATLNACTIVCAVGLWPLAGVYGFAIGYTAGSAAQLSIVWLATRSQLKGIAGSNDVPESELLRKPAPVLIYSALLALNLTITRGYATQLGPGTAAAFEYCMRCLGVPLAFLVSPSSNSLLPEIARRWRESDWLGARRLTQRALALVGAASVAGCVLGIVFCKPLVALLFERGSFTAQSTLLVSAVFVGFAPSLIGWSLLEITGRSLFAMNQSWLPVRAAALAVCVNLAFVLVVRDTRPVMLGVGASAGLGAAFLLLTLWARPRLATGRT